MFIILSVLTIKILFIFIPDLIFFRQNENEKMCKFHTTRTCVQKNSEKQSVQNNDNVLIGRVAFFEAYFGI